ncbi:MAG TPA: hypothetical protein PLU10_13135, partial [Chitinophagaceae bacterium]|nr:hypothetical protein [Chitinophagaceae bacterium]
AGVLSEVIVSNGMAYLGGYKLDAITNNDIHMVKYDISTDNVIYDKTYGGSTSDYLHTLSYNYDSKFFKLEGNDLFLLAGTTSPNFPVTDGSALSGSNDDLYIKLDAATGNINFATYIGGTDGLFNYGPVDLRVDGGGVYIFGLTDDSNFPVTDGSTYKGNVDYYLRKYNVSNNALVFSKYLGTSEQEYGGAMEVENGIIYLSGYLQSSVGWPHTLVYGSYVGFTHLFLTKLNSSSGNVSFSTWINSNANEEFGTLKVVDGNAYVLGLTYGTATNTYPVTNGSKKVGSNGSADVVLTKFNSDNQICFSTFVGGNNEDVPLSMTVQNDYVYYAGYSSSNNYPVTNSVVKKPVNDYMWTKFNLNPVLNVTVDNVTPATQTVCKNGMAATFTAPAITFPADSMPTIYRNAVPSTQTAIELKYQWQQAPSASGPWTNIPAAIKQDYIPQVGLVDVYYRRIANASVCGSNTPISISSVASVLVNANTAPTVTVGNV